MATPAAHPASEALRSRESARYGNGLRAVLLAYPDGAADLVLVAHRRAVDSAGLDLVARVLAGTADAAEHLMRPRRRAAPHRRGRRAARLGPRRPAPPASPA